jgi:hypothetical protein
MRTRLLAAMTAAAMTAAVVVVPFLSAAAHASPPEHKCDQLLSTEHKCGKGGKG